MEFWIIISGALLCSGVGTNIFLKTKNKKK